MKLKVTTSPTHWCDDDDDVVENYDLYMADNDGNNDEDGNDDDDGNNDEDGNDDDLHLSACPHIHSGWSDCLPS